MPQGVIYAFRGENPFIEKKVLGVKLFYFSVREFYKITGRINFLTDMEEEEVKGALEGLSPEIINCRGLEQGLGKLELDSEDLFIISAALPLLRAETLLQAYDFYASKGRPPVRLATESHPIDAYILPAEAKDDFLRITFQSFRVEEEEGLQVEDTFDLSFAAEVLRLEKLEELMEEGVEVMDPSTTWVSQLSQIGKGTVIYPFNFIAGKTIIGREVTIYPFCHIYSSQIEDQAIIYPSSFLKEVVIRKKVQIGPFARLRDGAEIMEGARIGNFVEVKKSKVGRRTKALHLTYLGDATIGEEANIGAGTITCNYDGEKKHPTYIEDRAFIGSGVELVAPVRVGHDAYVAAGSTITEDVPPFALAIARQRQVNKIDWVKKKRAEKEGKS